MSARWRATWYSSRTPLPPRMSRASEQTCLAFLALFIFAREAIAAGHLALLLELARAGST